MFLFSARQPVVTYKSFIHESPCEFNKVAITDARAICITLADLHRLYKKSHTWEQFGRLMAEKAFDIAVDRAESFVFKSADINTLNEIFHGESSWHTPGKSSAGGKHKGKEAVFTQFGKYGGETNGTFKAILKTLALCEDGRVVGIHHNTGERNGRKQETECCIVFEIKDGQIYNNWS